MSHPKRSRTKIGSSKTTRLFSTRSEKSAIPKSRTYPSHLRFVSQNALEKFNTTFSRSVLTGKPINLSSFDECHIENMFVRQGWKEFLKINEKIYSNLVQTIYANLIGL